MKKKNDVDFFDFMHYTIWPQIEKYIDDNAGELQEGFNDGTAGIILAYGWGGMANWGSKKGLKRRIKNIMRGSLHKGILDKNELTELCDEVCDEYEGKDED